MTEEQKIFAGKLYCPGDPELRAIKLKTHNLCTKYNQTFEDETEIRRSILADIFWKAGRRQPFTGANLYSLWTAYQYRQEVVCQF